MSTQQQAQAELAFQLWEERGCPAGSAEPDWVVAEGQIQKKEPTTGQSGARSGVSAEGDVPASSAGRAATPAAADDTVMPPAAGIKAGVSSYKSLSHVRRTLTAVLTT